MTRLAQLVAMVAATALVVVLPHVASDYHAYQGAQVGLYFIAILGLAVLTGYSGQISLGHGAFMAIGAYTTAILTAHHGVGELWTIPCAGAVAGVFGFAFGLPALRLSGAYLSLATFGLAIAVPSLAKKFDHFTGGSTGLLLPIHTGRWLYGVTWVCAGILLAAAWFLLRGRTGRALRAIRDSEIAAVSSGVNLALFKTAAFALSAAYAGVAGSLLVIGAGFANPDTFPITLSLTILIGLVIGGLGSLWGLIAGALFVEFMPIYAQHLSKQAPDLIYGVVLIAVMLVLPTGAAGLMRRLLGPLEAKPEQPVARSDPEASSS